MYKNLSGAMLLGLFLIGALGIASSAYPIAFSSSPPALIHIYPSRVENFSLVPGSIFSIEVRVSNVTELNSVAFNMSYDTTVLSCLGLYAGALPNMPIISFSINDQIGSMCMNITYEKPLTASGNATLATVVFQAEKRGASPLTISNTSLIDTLGQPIEHGAQSGYFRNVSPYDLNLDGSVDIIDILIVASAFGSEPGDSNWNPVADLNKDNIVDIFDLVAVSTHFG